MFAISTWDPIITVLAKLSQYQCFVVAKLRLIKGYIKGKTRLCGHLLLDFLQLSYKLLVFPFLLPKSIAKWVKYRNLAFSA